MRSDSPLLTIAWVFPILGWSKQMIVYCEGFTDRVLTLQAGPESPWFEILWWGRNRGGIFSRNPQQPLRASCPGTWSMNRTFVSRASWTSLWNYGNGMSACLMSQHATSRWRQSASMFVCFSKVTFDHTSFSEIPNPWNTKFVVLLDWIVWCERSSNSNIKNLLNLSVVSHVFEIS